MGPLQASATAMRPDSALRDAQPESHARPTAPRSTHNVATSERARGGLRPALGGGMTPSVLGGLQAAAERGRPLQARTTSEPTAMSHGGSQLDRNHQNMPDVPQQEHSRGRVTERRVRAPPSHLLADAGSMHQSSHSKAVPRGFAAQERYNQSVHELDRHHAVPRNPDSSQLDHGPDPAAADRWAGRPVDQLSGGNTVGKSVPPSHQSPATVPQAWAAPVQAARHWRDDTAGHQAHEAIAAAAADAERAPKATIDESVQPPSPTCESRRSRGYPVSPSPAQLPPVQRALPPHVPLSAASPFVAASPLSERPGSPLRTHGSGGAVRTSLSAANLTPAETFLPSPGSGSFHTAASPSDFPSPRTDPQTSPTRAPPAKSPLGPSAAPPASAPQPSAGFTPLRTEPACPDTLRVHSLTYNMGRVKLSRGVVASLPPACFGDVSAAGADAPPPDVLVIATQENDSASQWIALLTELLEPRGYVLPYGGASVNSAPGGSFFMTVALFVRRPLQALTTDVRVGRVTCGMGNKVCPSLQLARTAAPQTNCSAPA